MPNLTDLRVIKTKRNIRQSFLSLLSQHSFDEITVAHILTHAQINRTTFYKHYASKHDLAKQLVDECVQTIFVPLFAHQFAQTDQEFLEKLNATLSLHRALILPLWQIHRPNINLQKSLHAIIAQSYIQHYQGIADPSENLTLQGHLNASFDLPLIEFLLYNQNISTQELLANMKILTQRVLTP